ncbi:MAG: PrsW family glutamic-type intramembrane protease [Bacteroidales bacterium]|jgi:RsiW-degrading membrane proteinase PrsW (M82 family)|nr:PrsW family glutamic-type intramembrane protease [Bacteroidales bacterium]
MSFIIAALAPVVIILFYIYFRDKYEREPIGLLLMSIFAGVLITIPVIFIEQLISSGNPFKGSSESRIGNAAYDAFLVAALVEEAFKFLALYLLIWSKKNFNEKFDGIVYAVFISLGFAAVENIMYVSRGGMDVALTRALTAVPAHAIFGIRMGYYFGIAHMYKELKKSHLILAFISPFFLHGLYDFILMTQINWLLLLFIPYLVLLYYVGLKKMKIISDSSVFKEDIDIPE